MPLSYPWKQYGVAPFGKTVTHVAVRAFSSLQTFEACLIENMIMIGTPVYEESTQGLAQMGIFGLLVKNQESEFGRNRSRIPPEDRRQRFFILRKPHSFCF